MSCIHLLYCDKSHYQNFTPPFDIPDSWQWVRLEDICTIKGGKRIPKGKGFSEIPTQHIYIRVTNMKSNTIISDDLKYIEEEVYKEIKNYTISKDDLYLTIAGTIGAVGIVPNELDGVNLTENAAKLTNILIDKEYLMYVLLSTASQDHFSSKFHQVAQPKLSIETASTTIIPVPPIAEQYRIVNNIKTFLSELHKLENGSRNLKQAIASVKAKILDLAMQGKLVSQEPTDEPAADMLRRVNPKAKIITDNPHYPQLPDNWVLTRIKDVFEINPKNKASDNIQAGFVPMASIHDGYSNKFHYDVKQWGEIKSGFTHFADGDIAVAKISPCLENRKSMILRDLPNGIGAGTTELLIFRSTILIPEFSLLFFKSDNFIKCCTGTFNGVVGQQRVGKSIVEDIHIPIPPLNTQRAIVQRVQEWVKFLDNIIVNL